MHFQLFFFSFFESIESIYSVLSVGLLIVQILFYFYLRYLHSTLHTKHQNFLFPYLYFKFANLSNIFKLLLSFKFPMNDDTDIFSWHNKKGHLAFFTYSLQVQQSSCNVFLHFWSIWFISSLTFFTSLSIFFLFEVTNHTPKTVMAPAAKGTIDDFISSPL